MAKAWLFFRGLRIAYFSTVVRKAFSGSQARFSGREILAFGLVRRDFPAALQRKFL